MRDLSATGLSIAAWRLPVRRCALPLSPAYGSAGQSQQIAGAHRHRMLRAPICNTPPPDPNMRALSPTAREVRAPLVVVADHGSTLTKVTVETSKNPHRLVRIAVDSGKVRAPRGRKRGDGNGRNV